MSKLNIALIGAGRRGAGAHLPVIPALSDTYRLVAVCDIDEETAQKYARQYGVNAYTDVRRMAAEEELDVADVTVPGPAHHAVCVYLARQGVNILCETPIAVTLAQADMMIEAAREGGVVLEIAENYYRAPMERFKTELIERGVIGKVSRIYRVFREGGYHGMSMLRLRAGGNPVSVLGIAHETPVIPHIDRMKRRHTSERWSLSYIDFDSGAAAVMMYSNVIHGRTLGRKVNSTGQVHGESGAIVENDVYAVPAAELEAGAIARAYAPRRVTKRIDGVDALQRIELELPDETVVWENPLAHLPILEGRVNVADELLSAAAAVRSGEPPEYGAEAGRLDQEMNIAVSESARRGRESIFFPLTEETAGERSTHASYQANYGVEWNDVDGLLDVYFPRR